MPAPELETASFRDRHGRVFYEDGRVLRAISDTAFKDWQHLTGTRLFKEFSERGQIVATRQLPDHPMLAGKRWAAVLEHERIPVVSYPYEWSFGMLKSAALLQLDLLAAALEEGMIIKDASAYNIQWRGVQPVFIDTPSFEIHNEGEPWAGYLQFCELYLYPLLIQSYKHIAFNSLLRGRLDGIEPSVANAFFGFRDRFRPGVFKHVYLQSKMQERFGDSRRNVRSELKQAGFNKEMIKVNVRNLRKVVAGLDWSSGGTEWAQYGGFHNYSETDLGKKEAFVEKAVQTTRPQWVWDIGANTGQFSRIASRHADYVLALDIDPGAVEKHYRDLLASGTNNVLPLVFNLADPSPDWGWRGGERRSLGGRSNPDLILCLALIHHAVITANIPLPEFIAWLAGTDAALVIEFVSKDDEQVQKLLLNKEDQYADYEQSVFEQCLKDHYTIERTESLASGNRHLYYCLPRS